MQLSCGYHWVSGARADNRCRKCERRQEKKIPVDTKFSAAHLRAVSLPSLPPPVDATRRTDKTTSVNLTLLGADATRRAAVVMKGDCVGCQRAMTHGVVWGLRLCFTCAERVNRAAPRDVVTGLGYVIAVCAWVQALRESKR